MVKFHFSIRAAIVTFVIDLVGGVLSIVWSVNQPTSVRGYAASFFLAPYIGIEALLEHFRIFLLGNSLISILLPSCIPWACVAGFVRPLFRRGTPTI
jgi:hypothetical protein